MCTENRKGVSYFVKMDDIDAEVAKINERTCEKTVGVFECFVIQCDITEEEKKRLFNEGLVVAPINDEITKILETNHLDIKGMMVKSSNNTLCLSDLNKLTSMIGAKLNLDKMMVGLCKGKLVLILAV